MLVYPAREVVLEFVDDHIFGCVEVSRGPGVWVIHLSPPPGHSRPLQFGGFVRINQEDVRFEPTLGINDIERLTVDESINHCLKISVIALCLKSLNKTIRFFQRQDNCDVNILGRAHLTVVHTGK